MVPTELDLLRRLPGQLNERPGTRGGGAAVNERSRDIAQLDGRTIRDRLARLERVNFQVLNVAAMQCRAFLGVD